MASKSCIHSYAGVSIVETDGILRPCCKYQATENTPTIFSIASLDDLYTTEYYKTLQSQLDSGVFPVGCDRCKVDEDAGIQSSRQNTMDSIFDNGNLLVKNSVQDLEIGLDFTCNMMCRMCNPATSSKWGQATTAIKQFDQHDVPLYMVKSLKDYKTYQTKIVDIFNNTDLSKAVHLRLEGGEPFYSKNLEWFIDKLDREVADKNHFNISIFTNGSIFPAHHILEKLIKFNVNITFSFDAVGELASTIRWGVDWDVIESVVTKWKAISDTHSNVKLCTCSTVSLLNVNKVTDLIEFCKKFEIHVNFNHLTIPEYLSIYQVPHDVRSRWLIKRDDFDDLLLADIHIEPQYTTFLKSVEILDDYQKKSFALVNPDIYNLIVDLSKH